MAWFQNTQGAKASHFVFEATLTPASVGAAVSAEQAFTITSGNNSSTLRAGLSLDSTDFVGVTGPTAGNATAPVGARVNATGQVVIQFVNPTAGALTPAAGVYRFHVVKK